MKNKLRRARTPRYAVVRLNALTERINVQLRCEGIEFYDDIFSSFPLFISTYLESLHTKLFLSDNGLIDSLILDVYGIKNALRKYPFYTCTEYILRIPLRLLLILISEYTKSDRSVSVYETLV